MSGGRGCNVTFFLPPSPTLLHALADLSPFCFRRWACRGWHLQFLCLWPETGDRDVRGEPRGCGAEQSRWVQPVGDVQSLLPLWVWVTRNPSGRTIAQVQEIRIRDPLQPPARGSAQAGSRAPPSFGLGAETCRSLRLAAGDRFFLARFSLAQRRPEMFVERLSVEHWCSLACCPGGLAAAVLPIH